MYTRLARTVTLILNLGFTSSCAPKYLKHVQFMPSQRSFSFSPTTVINYEVIGNGPTSLVMLHGFGASLESWRDVQPTLSEHFRLYLVDLKGHGLSSRPRDGRYSLEDQAEIVTAFLDHERLTNVVMVGHSYGGAVALLTMLKILSRTRANPVNGLILIDSAGYPQAFPFFIEALRNPLLNAFIELTSSRFQARYTLHRLFFDESKVTPDRIERYAQFYRLPGAHYALTQAAKQILPKNVDEFVGNLHTIDTPTLILWGENDPVIPVSFGSRLNADLQHSQLHIVKNCGHVLHEEQPDQTITLMTDFLNSHVRE